MNITITVHSINDKHNFTNVVFIHHLSILSMCSANKGGFENDVVQALGGGWKKEDG